MKTPTKPMLLVGIDEVGRGCWAGPVVAGAVIMAEPITGLTDSKLITKKKRQQLAIIIRQRALAWGVGWVDAATLDKIGLTAAVGLAMQRALDQIEPAYDSIIIDGNHNYLGANPKAQTLIKADLTIPAVSAASIIAKVARDDYMIEQSKQFPLHGFDKHVGYGTALHLASLKQYGLTELHRRSFKPVAALIQ